MASMGLDDPAKLEPRHLMRRVDEHTTSQLRRALRVARAGRAAPAATRARAGPRDWHRGERGDVRMTVAEHIVAALARQGVTHRLGRRRRRAEPGHRRDPPPRRDRLDRRAPRGGGRVRGLRPGAADRHARASAWARSGPARSTCSTASTTPRSRTRRCSRCAGRCRSPSSARTSSRRSTTTRCSPTSRSSGTRSRAREQLPNLLERAVQSALTERGVAVLTLPGDVGELDLPEGHARGALHRPAGQGRPRRPTRCTRPRARIDQAGKVTLLVGIGAREARAEVLALAEKLAAPMVLTLKAKEGLERDNPFQVGQTGLIGNPAARHALDGCDLLLMLGTDFPYSRLVSGGQGRRAGRRRGRAHRPPHAGRRRRGRRRRPRRAPRCSTASRPSPTATTSRTRPAATPSWRGEQRKLADPAYEDDGRDPQAAREVRQPGHSASAPRRSPTRSTPTPPPTRSSPATPACRPSGSRASSSSPAPAG